MGEILVRQGGGWAAPQVVGYALESELQALLAEHPALVPGVGPDGRSCREFQTEPGPIDLVIVNENGEITLVECKLASNPQIRREIIGQLFDYASCFWKMDVNDFLAKWRNRGSDLLADLDDEKAEVLREAVARNLADGRFRLVLAADEINKSLKRIVEYLNVMSGSETSVIAVAYTRMNHGTLELLVPEIYGQESAEAKANQSEPVRVVWDLPAYRTWIQENDSQAIAGFDVLVAAARSAGLFLTGSLAVKPSAGFPILDSLGQQLGTLSVLTYGAMGISLELNFNRLAAKPLDERPPADQLQDFLDDLSEISEFSSVAENLKTTDFRSRAPNVSLRTLSPGAIEKLVSALKGLMSSPS
ncbi:hypothetical protein D477_012860 [Arthrobacter crystallopoietes BAB-32]|uniref:DUF91 domain-containing protein n=1 Tax=Arthrobacter crystallopoietes BAB-32 TaxID=1246476 RepID=N1V1B4_9MICC|nr:hypothetical protein [Arthrobacter crystallopoietes]EMY33857.1 hypothetical protein D477_012860 [Arthrobacter crystallopoietes BAB-32]